MAILAAALAAASAPALAQQTTVTTLESGAAPSTNDGTTFTANSADLSQNRGGPGISAAVITANPALDSNGSLELTGDRSRVYNNLIGEGIASTSLVSFTGDYLVNNSGSAGIQSPAFRVYIQGANGGFNELIWEAAYNGGYALGVEDSVSSSDRFWRQLVGQGFDGTTGIGTGSYVMHTVAEWGDILGGSVLGIGVGQGSGAGVNFSALADNLALTFDSGSAPTTLSYDFAAAQAPVPEPGTWAMMLLGFGAIGVAARRRKAAVAMQTA